MAPPSPLLTVPNVTAHPSTASVPVAVLLCDGLLLCGFNLAIKGLTLQWYEKMAPGISQQWYCDHAVKFATWQHPMLGCRVRFDASGNTGFACLAFLFIFVTLSWFLQWVYFAYNIWKWFVCCVLFSDDDDINDVATMGGVNLSEESRNILSSSSELIGTQVRSCRDEPFLDISALNSRIQRIGKLFEIRYRWNNKSTLICHLHVWVSHTYDTMRYDSGYLTCSKKLTGSQLSLPHGHAGEQL